MGEREVGKHSRFSLLLSFELLCRYFFGHMHTHLEEGFFFLSLALPILLYAQYSLLCLHVGGKEENLPTSYSPLSFLSFFNGCIKGKE